MAMVKIGIPGFKKHIGVIFKVSWYLVLSLFNADFYELPKENIGRDRLWS